MSVSGFHRNNHRVLALVASSAIVPQGVAFEQKAVSLTELEVIPFSATSSRQVLVEERFGIQEETEKLLVENLNNSSPGLGVTSVSIDQYLGASRRENRSVYHAQLSNGGSVSINLGNASASDGSRPRTRDYSVAFYDDKGKPLYSMNNLTSNGAWQGTDNRGPYQQELEDSSLIAQGRLLAENVAKVPAGMEQADRKLRPAADNPAYTHHATEDRTTSVTVSEDRQRAIIEKLNAIGQGQVTSISVSYGGKIGGESLLLEATLQDGGQLALRMDKTTLRDASYNVYRLDKDRNMQWSANNATSNGSWQGDVFRTTGQSELDRSVVQKVSGHALAVSNLLNGGNVNAGPRSGNGPSQ